MEVHPETNKPGVDSSFATVIHDDMQSIHQLALNTRRPFSWRIRNANPIRRHPVGFKRKLPFDFPIASSATSLLASLGHGNLIKRIGCISCLCVKLQLHLCDSVLERGICSEFARSNAMPAMWFIISSCIQIWQILAIAVQRCMTKNGSISGWREAYLFSWKAVVWIIQWEICMEYSASSWSCECENPGIYDCGIRDNLDCCSNRHHSDRTISTLRKPKFMQQC